MNLSHATLPTPSAMSIAKAAKLIPPERLMSNVDEYDDSLARLVQFQQMALVCEYEDCLIAYHGCDIEESHTAALELIHKTTRPWLYGHVMSELLDLINNQATGGRDAVEAAKVVIEGLTKEGGSVEDVAEKFIVNVYKHNSEENVV